LKQNLGKKGLTDASQIYFLSFQSVDGLCEIGSSERTAQYLESVCTENADVSRNAVSELHFYHISSY